MAPLDSLAVGRRGNAVVVWTLTALLVAEAVRSYRVDAALWAGFTLAVVAVIAGPAVVFRDWTALVPWPAVSVVVGASLLRASGHYLELAGYLSIAATALIVVLELNGFTAVELSRRFGVAFAAMTTMAIQGLWTIAQYYSDRWLGTGFLESQTELQWDLVLVTLAGLAVGLLFGWYFGRDRTESFVDRRSGY